MAIDPILLGLATAVVGALSAAVATLYKERGEERKRMQARIDKLEGELAIAIQARVDTAEKNTSWALTLQEENHEVIGKLATVAEALQKTTRGIR